MTQPTGSAEYRPTADDQDVVLLPQRRIDPAEWASISRTLRSMDPSRRWWRDALRRRPVVTVVRVARQRTPRRAVRLASVSRTTGSTPGEPARPRPRPDVAA